MCFFISKEATSFIRLRQYRVKPQFSACLGQRILEACVTSCRLLPSGRDEIIVHSWKKSGITNVPTGDR
ncbi:hypothetical protein SDC9_94239 [bioreactor metagenome]|uniref:Uncharacterized protein n=1 Tax=bioreactor metagenome TaxID=1076179 RepID=A0A645A4A0_9ZZZZ